jgi:hypothetical protein
MASSTSPVSSENDVTNDRLVVPTKKYDVQTSFDAMNKGVFLISSAALYFAEMLATHPLEVLRASIQVSQKVRTIDLEPVFPA